MVRLGAVEVHCVRVLDRHSHDSDIRGILRRVEHGAVPVRDVDIAGIVTLRGIRATRSAACVELALGDGVVVAQELELDRIVHGRVEGVGRERQLAASANRNRPTFGLNHGHVGLENGK